jgi:hypothetical protein
MADAKVPRVLLGEDDRPCAFEAPRVAIVGTRAATRLSIADAREIPRSVPAPASPWSTASQDWRNWLDTAHHHGRRRVGRGAVAQLTRRIPPHTSPCRSPTTHTNGNARGDRGPHRRRSTRTMRDRLRRSALAHQPGRHQRHGYCEACHSDACRDGSPSARPKTDRCHHTKRAHTIGARWRSRSTRSSEGSRSRPPGWARPCARSRSVAGSGAGGACGGPYQSTLIAKCR